MTYLFERFFGRMTLEPTVGLLMRNRLSTPQDLSAAMISLLAESTHPLPQLKRPRQNHQPKRSCQPSDQKFRENKTSTQRSESSGIFQQQKRVPGKCKRMCLRVTGPHT